MTRTQTKNKPANEYKRTLKTLTEAVIQCEKAIEVAMHFPSTRGRGKRIALIMNRLTIANQSAMHFTLDYSFKKINKLYSISK